MLRFTKLINPTLRTFSPHSSLYFSFSMLKFNLPDLGQKIKQGTIKKLYVKQGDTVEEFQKLADVASDKQFTEITAADSGVIRKLHYQEEDVCQVGDLFLEIEVSEEGQTPQQTQKEVKKQIKKEAKQENKSSESKKQDGDIFATPFVRGLIKKYNLNPLEIKGTGENGRIVELDVESFQKGRSSPSYKPLTPPPKQATSTVSQQTIQMSPYQKGMQKSMTESNTIPHLYYHEEYDITELQKVRQMLKKSSKKVTVMGLLVKTFSIALKKHPKINSLYRPDINQFQYTIHPDHNISIAIDSPNGLVVPNIKSVNTKSLGDIQSELQRLKNLATEAKITSKDLLNGTICLSNIGTVGGILAAPLILPPQVCIVAITKVQNLPKFVNGQLQQRKCINVSFGCDHRIIDGGTVAKFCNQWKNVIENPYVAFAEMV